MNNLIKKQKQTKTHHTNMTLKKVSQVQTSLNFTKVDLDLTETYQQVSNRSMIMTS